MSHRPSAGPVAAVHTRSVALVLLVSVAFVWGFHWVVVKQGLQFMPPFTYGTLRLVTGLVAMVVVLAAQRRLRLPPRADLPIIGSVGIGQVAAGVVLMNLALQVVPAGRSAVLVYTTPLWIALLLWLVFRTPPRRAELVGLVLGLAGIIALVNPSVINWEAPAELLGTLALLTQAVLWGAVAIHIRRHRWTASPLDLQPWMLLVALVPVAVAAFVLEPNQTVIWEPTTILILAYSGLLATAYANWANQSATRSLGPMATSIGFLLAPVVGLVSGALVLHESLGPVDILGFGLVLAGIAAATLTAPPSPTTEAVEAVAPVA